MSNGASAGTYFLSGSLGFIWRAATGTVDPWTKQILVSDQTAGVTRAGGDPGAAQIQAHNDVTNILTQAGADPSQVINFDILQSLGEVLMVGTIVVVVYVIYKAITLGEKIL